MIYERILNSAIFIHSNIYYLKYILEKMNKTNRLHVDKYPMIYEIECI